MSDRTLELRLLASSIVRGSTVRAECVECGEPTMTVTHKEDGRIAYQCKRASCGIAGYVGASMFRSEREAPQPRVWQYTLPLHRIELVDAEYFSARFGLSGVAADRYIRLTDFGEYAFLVLGPAGNVRGHVIRQPTWNAGRQKMAVWAPRQGRKGEPKSREFLCPGDTGLAWYQRNPLREKRPVVVVEDQVSAMAAAQVGYLAVALLGTFATYKEADEIRRIAERDNVLIALDEDATSNAFAFSQKWGMSFENCRVVRLRQDLKDEDPNNIRNVLGV